MSNGESADQAIWEWLNQHIPQDTIGFAFTGQSIHPRGMLEPPYIDALWRYVTAGILRLAGDSNFSFTEAGKLAVAEDISPYQKSSFLDGLDAAAPRLDDDSRAYVSLVLDCLFSVPTAALVLTRVALEKELDSVTAICIDHWDLQGTNRRNLRARDLNVRFEQLAIQLINHQIQDAEGGRLFSSYFNLVRITANGILHPRGGMPEVNPLMVRSVIYAFMGFASLASQAKDWFQNNAQ